MTIDDVIKPLIGSLGISESAERLMWKYNDHAKKHYVIRDAVEPVLFGEHTITRYISLTGEGVNKLRYYDENKLIHGGKQ